MPQPSPEQIADIVFHRRQVYDLDTDSHIRQAANRLTVRALFELLAQFDDQSPDFPARLSACLRELPPSEPSYLIAFATGEHPTEDDSADVPETPHQPVEYYLRLVFSNEDAAFYQFDLFPNLDADHILGAARKRAGAVQHLRLTLSRPEALQHFIGSWRANPHFVRVEESTPDEFHRAPSNTV